MKNLSEYDLYDLPGGHKVGSVQESRVLPWVAARGNELRGLGYPLNRNSVVYDIGGYIGVRTEALNQTFGCRIEVFEPIAQYVQLLQKKFAKHPNIIIHDFGLGGKAERVRISVENEASSVFKNSEASELITIKRVSQHLYHDNIDLMTMNIEGGEFGLLHDLIATGRISAIDNIEIQFHDFAPNAVQERRKLHAALAKTHVMTFNYPWVWEAWRRRNG